jgi:peroxiredoxin
MSAAPSAPVQPALTSERWRSGVDELAVECRSRAELVVLRGGLAMALTQNSICAFGWKARDFALEGVDGKTYSLADVRGPKGTLVVFICNHCPHVKSSIERIVSEAKSLGEIGVGTIAIMPNDTEAYREDSFENMKVFAAKHGFNFPYVIDETQEVAPAYGARCAPDFFGFNARDELQYR